MEKRRTIGGKTTRGEGGLLSICKGRCLSVSMEGWLWTMHAYYLVSFFLLSLCLSMHASNPKSISKRARAGRVVVEQSAQPEHHQIKTNQAGPDSLAHGGLKKMNELL